MLRFRHRPHILCQTLTDFSNGEYFKTILKEKGYEGYIFNENPDSNTFCFFNSDKLTPPIHTIITFIRTLCSNYNYRIP